MSLLNQRCRTLVSAAVAVIGAVCLSASAQPAKTSGGGAAATLTDPRNGRTYKTVKIGNQTWMAENLNFQTPSGSWCYSNDNSKCQQYGRLYDWKTATGGKTSIKANPIDVQGVCPAGWHLPSSPEWTELAKAAGGTGTQGDVGIAGERLKAKNGWYMNGNGTDNYGFSALPGGWRDSTGIFKGDRMYGDWWTSSNNSGLGVARQMGNTDEFVTYITTTSNKNGFSVRCVMDAAKAKTDGEGQSSSGKGASSGTFTDTRDNKSYKVVKIDGKNWMAENLNYKIGNSWCYNDDESKCKQYGRLYDLNTAKTACPKGWHLPSKEEWTELVATVDSETGGKKLKSKSGWNEPGNGTDELGFSALPGGHRRSSDGSFADAGEFGYWWANAKRVGGGLYYLSLDYGQDNVVEDYAGEGNGFSVRCAQD
jgi:uncharacterized protein (TIGR02145 family)